MIFTTIFRVLQLCYAMLNTYQFVQEYVFSVIFVEMPVPIAIIVCEGDLKTIEHISIALKNEIPVIIMKGSGMAADLVCERLQK